MVRSAQLVDGEGIEIRGIRIVEPGATGPQAELLYVDEMFISCPTDLLPLIEDRLEIKHIIFRRPTLRLTRRSDGSWSGARLLPLPQFSAKPPVAKIENATLEVFDPTKNPSSTFRLRDANLQVGPLETAQPSADGKFPLHLEGYATGDHLRQVGLNATFYPGGGLWQASGLLDGLEVSPELIRSLPATLPAQCAALEALRGQVNARYTLQYDVRQIPAFDFEVAGTLQRGRLDDPRLPYPLTELRSTFRCDARSCTIEELTARSGQATLRLNARRQGYSDSSPLELRAEARRLTLDSKLLEILPDRWQQEWHKFLPSGEVDLDVKLGFDGTAWHPELVCKCLNASFSYHKFPYRLERTRGTLELKDGRLKTNLVAASESAQLRLVGETQVLPEPGPSWFEIRGEEVRFDEKLLSAMPGTASNIVRALNPYGKFNIFGRFWRGDDAVEHKHLALNLSQCAVRFDKFPYPLDNIRGVIEMNDSEWTFRELHGSNGTARITCSGKLFPTPTGPELHLHFGGAQVLLEDELRDALSPAARQLWTALKPQGTINLETQVRFCAGDPAIGLWVRAEPVGESVSIEPTYFPYRLEKLSGVFTLADGRVSLDNIKAEHGRTNLSARGWCDLRPEGGWHLKLEQMSVDRLYADRDLVQAVPGRLKKILADLHTTGAVNLRGSFELGSTGTPGDDFSSGWDVNLDLHQNSADLGLDLQNMNGGLHLLGSARGPQFRCQGTVQLDSVTYKDVQFTEVNGPLWIDETRVLVGFWADRLLNVKPERHLTARLYGGTTNADGWVLFGTESTYDFHTSLTSGDLTQWKQETLGGRQKLSGEIYGQLQLRGKGRSLNDLGGRGSLELRNADIYEIPLMVSLLKILSVRPPDSTAFTSSDMKFRIEGEHVYLDRIDFNGDAVSLIGKGEMNLNRQIHLTFHAMVGRNRGMMPAVKDVLGGASRQLMVIHAEGPIDQPVVRREAFPGVNQAFQQLQAELQPATVTR